MYCQRKITFILKIRELLWQISVKFRVVQVIINRSVTQCLTLNNIDHMSSRLLWAAALINVMPSEWFISYLKMTVNWWWCNHQLAIALSYDGTNWLSTWAKYPSLWHNKARVTCPETGDRSERGQTGSDAVKTSHAKADSRTREHQTDPIYLLIF